MQLSVVGSWKKEPIWRPIQSNFTISVDFVSNIRRSNTAQQVWTFRKRIENPTEMEVSETATGQNVQKSSSSTSESVNEVSVENNTDLFNSHWINDIFYSVSTASLFDGSLNQNAALIDINTFFFLANAS